MKLTITIDMDNAAFEGEQAGPEAARILREVADRFNGPPFHCPLFDINGNRVGQANVTDNGSTPKRAR